jgi:rubrerythrin
MRLGTGTSERLVAALIVSTVVVFGILALSLAAKVPVGYALTGATIVLLIYFGLSAVLILCSSDGQLSDERARAEAELEYARDRATLEQAREWEDEARGDAKDCRDERRRRREEEIEDRHSRRRREVREEGYRCPYCRTREYPIMESKISAAGWVFFWLTCLFICWPICWIGLLIKDTYRVCPVCGARS